jgi:hypothetical protein
MKALSLLQPWASLIVCGLKDIENRDWHAPRNLIGQRIAIHASKKLDPEEFDSAMSMARGIGCFGNADDWNPQLYPHGCIIGEATLAAVVKESTSPWFVGEFGFVLTNPKSYLRPIPIRGQLGFWQVPDGLIQ